MFNRVLREIVMTMAVYNLRLSFTVNITPTSHMSPLPKPAQSSYSLLMQLKQPMLQPTGKGASQGIWSGHTCHSRNNNIDG